MLEIAFSLIDPRSQGLAVLPWQRVPGTEQGPERDQITLVWITEVPCLPSLRAIADPQLLAHCRGGARYFVRFRELA